MLRGEAVNSPCRLSGVERGPWTVEHRQGPVSRLLELEEPAPGTPRRARVHVVDRPALVLGSAQSPAIADAERAAAAGVEIVRRRSGGGAVLLEPGRQLWVDFFVPASDPLWRADVGEAAIWVGELWSEAVAPFLAEPAVVYSGRLVADRWGKLVCFAGSGPGEVFAAGRKLVGVSQRRNRSRARIQTMARLAGGPATGHDAACAGCDELDFLALTAAERGAGRGVLASRRGAVPADDASVIKTLDAALRRCADRQ